MLSIHTLILLRVFFQPYTRVSCLYTNKHIANFIKYTCKINCSRSITNYEFRIVFFFFHFFILPRYDNVDHAVDDEFSLRGYFKINTPCLPRNRFDCFSMLCHRYRRVLANNTHFSRIKYTRNFFQTRLISQLIR